jgi:hypothetical protein
VELNLIKPKFIIRLFFPWDSEANMWSGFLFSTRGSCNWIKSFARVSGLSAHLVSWWKIVFMMGKQAFQSAVVILLPGVIVFDSIDRQIEFSSPVGYPLSARHREGLKAITEL